MSKDNSTKDDESSQREAASVKLQPVSRVIPEEIQSLLGKRPIVTGEDPETYDDLLARISSVVKPKDAIEWLWVKDVVDTTWEIQRYRRLRAALLDAAHDEALVHVLSPLCSEVAPENWSSYEYAEELVRAWVKGDMSARETIDAVFSDNAIDLDTVMSRALIQRLDSFERIDRLIASAEARRDRSIREIDARRVSHVRLRQLLTVQGPEGGTATSADIDAPESAG